MYAKILSLLITLSQNVTIMNPLFLHGLPGFVHHTVVNAFKGTINLKSLCPGQQLKFKPPASLKG
jgi:hypothetical protein